MNGYVTNLPPEIILQQQFLKLQSMEFLGITDMVKKITFQAKDVNGSSISHSVNNMYLLLSENYGLIRTINFKVFPDFFDEHGIDENVMNMNLAE